MDTDLVKKLAIAAGATKAFASGHPMHETASLVGNGFIEKFAALVAEHCARIADDQGQDESEGWADAAASIAATIRAKFGCPPK